jgi:putative tricarboxylic transport membrane protein
MTFVQRPISAGLLVLGAILLVLAVLPMIRSKRETVFVEE